MSRTTANSTFWAEASQITLEETTGAIPATVHGNVSIGTTRTSYALALNGVNITAGGGGLTIGASGSPASITEYTDAMNIYAENWYIGDSGTSNGMTAGDLGHGQSLKFQYNGGITLGLLQMRLTRRSTATY